MAKTEKGRMVFLEKKYRNFWKSHSKTFEEATVDKNKKIHVLERENRPNDNIPCVEIATGRSNDTGQGGLIIVGMNPAGTDIGYYKSNNANKEVIFQYDKDDDTSGFIKANKEFAKRCRFDDNYLILDLFCIVQSKQEVIEKHLLKGDKEILNSYKEMFRIFVDAVISKRPNVIVFANAFVSKLILRDKWYYNDEKKSKKEIEIFNYVVDNHVNCKWDEAICGYDITFTSEGKSHLCSAFFTSMLSGQRALDNETKRSLACLVSKVKRKRKWSVLKIIFFVINLPSFFFRKRYQS